MSNDSEQSFNSIDPSGDGPGGDSFTETTHQGWLSRIGNAFSGMLVGLVLAALSCAGLFWNEGRAVQTARSLTEGAGLVVAIDAGKVEPANEAKLVHATAALMPVGTLADAEFAMRFDGLRLERVVEMYQWREERHTEKRKNVGGSEDTITTYTYSRGWSKDPIDSGRFKQPGGHANPAMPYRGRSLLAEQATFGAFRPGSQVIGRVSAHDVVPVAPAQADVLRARLGRPVQAVDGTLYLGADPQNPVLGDMRISYRGAKGGTYSIVARQTGTDLTGYQTKAGDQLLLLRVGTQTAAQMFAGAQKENAILTWILRGVGMVVMMIGFSLLLRPLVVLGDVIPMLGTLVSYGTGLVAFMLTLVVAPLTIAIAWFWFRPLVSVAVLGGGLVLAFLVRQWGRSRAAAVSAARPPVTPTATRA